MNFIKRNRYIILSFSISFVLMIVAFALNGLFPFGNNQIMVIDSWHQYYPFLQELHQKLTTGGSLFYSWNSGLGSNFINIMAYYAMSPLNLLSVLFPQEYLREFMMLVTVLKISLAAMFFSIYIRKVFKNEGASLAIFGMLYAFSGFVMGYYWNIMWLDAVALLPLVILGLHRILDEEGYVLFIVTLAITLISNFYIGYIVAEFIFLYALVLYFSKYPWSGFKHFGKKIVWVGICSAIAVGLSAVVLLPAYEGLQLTYRINVSKPSEFKTYFSLLDIFNNMLPNVAVSVKSGLPNIYSGFFSLMLLILYFFIPSISLKKKALNFFLLMFLVVSFNINYLNYIWHGFSFTNEVPYRFAFAFSFLVLTLAYQAYLKFEEIHLQMVSKVLAVLFINLILYDKLYTEASADGVFYVSLIFLFLYGVVLLSHKHQYLTMKLFAGIIYFIMFGEIVLSAISGTQTVGSSGRQSYPSQNTAVQKEIDGINALDNSFFRVEMMKWYSSNDPVLYGYHGVSEFSSTINSNISTYAQKIGLAAAPEANRYLYASSTPILNGLLAIKYLIAKGDTGRIPNAAYEVMSEGDDVTVYKNKYYLPIGFMVEDTIAAWSVKSLNPFDIQEEFLKKATTQEDKVFEKVNASVKDYVNMTIGSQNGIRTSYKNGDASQVGKATHTYKVPKTGQMYLYMFANNTYNVEISLGEKTTKYEIRRGQVIDLGILEEGTSFDVKFEVFAEKSGFFDLQMVTFDEELFASAYKELADETFQVLSYSDTTIVGTIEVREAGTLFMSIPYEKGWKAKIDGKKAEIIPISDAMMSFPLDKGNHTVELSYIPAGFRLGLLVSFISLILLVIMFVFLRKRKVINI